MRHIALSLFALGLIALPVAAQAEDAATTDNAVAPTTAPAHQRLSPEDRAAKKDEMKAKWEAMTPEQKQAAIAEHKAKWEERYNNATPEQKAKMDARKAKFMDRMKSRGAGAAGAAQ